MKVKELKQLLINTYKVAALKPYETPTGVTMDSDTYNRITHEADEYVSGVVNMIINTTELDI